VNIWAEGKHPFNEFCGKLMGLAFNRKDEHLNDFSYHQETWKDLKLVNFETNPGSKSKSTQRNSSKIQESI
jgi:hypothetical protein